MTKSSAMLYTYHTMAEFLALKSMVELQSMIVTQTIVLLQTKNSLKKKDFKFEFDKQR